MEKDVAEQTRILPVSIHPMFLVLWIFSAIVDPEQSKHHHEARTDNHPARLSSDYCHGQDVQEAT